LDTAKEQQLNQVNLVYGILIYKQCQTADNAVCGQFRLVLAQQYLKYGAVAVAVAWLVAVSRAAAPAAAAMQLNLAQYLQESNLEYAQLGLPAARRET
jgi:hypothetical protein